MIAPDVGGGFGQKVMFPYPDELLVPLAAIELGVPVKYIEDRRENFIGSNQERKQIHHIELYSNKKGEVLALKDFFLHDTGAFIPYGIAIAQVASTSIAGPYRIPISMFSSRLYIRRLSQLLLTEGGTAASLLCNRKSHGSIGG